MNGSRGRLAVTALCALALSAAATGSADAQTFGANLARPANAGFGCEKYPTAVQVFGPQFVFLPDPSSCTWTSSGTYGEPARELVVPADGTITRARVRTGPSVGPMQVVTLRTLSGTPTPGGGLPAPAQCCIVQRTSQVFTPRPNAVTTVRVRLPVQNNQNAQGVGTFDSIGLSILAPNVAIPAHDETAQAANTLSNVFSPAVRRGTQNVNRNGVQGVQVLLSADLVPAFPVTLGKPLRAGPPGPGAGRPRLRPQRGLPGRPEPARPGRGRGQAQAGGAALGPLQARRGPEGDREGQAVATGAGAGAPAQERHNHPADCPEEQAIEQPGDHPAALTRPG